MFYQVLRLLSGAYTHLTLSALLNLRATAHYPRNTVAVSAIDVTLNDRFLASTPFGKGRYYSDCSAHNFTRKSQALIVYSKNG